MHPYGIGLDIGIASVGWAVVALDGDEAPYGIINMGSRVFDAAENPKDGSPLAQPRREARGMRRRLRRHRHRGERIREMIVRRGILTQNELGELFAGKQLEDIYAVRVRALDAPVTAGEFARILIHLSQRRGFRSNRKKQSDGDEGLLLSAVSRNEARMKENGYRTAAEMFLKSDDYKEHKRNKGGEYISTVSRDMVEAEARAIFSAQRGFGMEFAAAETEDEYLNILLSQRSFEEGPGEGSPYGGNQVENMIGRCTLIEEERRAPKASYSFEYFNLLTHVNSIKIIEGGSSVPLDAAQREQLIALAHKTEKLSFANLRKELKLSPQQTFNLVYYRAGEEEDTAEKKQKFSYLNSYHELRRAFDKISKGYISGMSREKINAAYALTVHKTDETVEKELRENGFSDAEIDALLSAKSFSKFGNLSVKACEILIPYLEQGMKYNEACDAAGLNFKAHGGEEKTKYLHLTEDVLESVTSPVVRRAVSQTVKVINAIIRERGISPTYINIELAREMAKDFKERNKIKKDMDENAARNERAMDEIRALGGQATGQNLLKYLLWQE